MLLFTSKRKTRRIWNPVQAVAIAAALWIAVPQARAEESFGNSVDWVPAEADMYYSSLRMGEQIQIVRQSAAWQRFRTIPSVAKYWKMAEDQLADPNGPLAAAVALMQLPENQQLLQVLGDMHAHEVTFYAGEGFHKIVLALAELQGMRQWQRIMTMGTEIEMEIGDAIEVQEDCQDDDAIEEEDGIEFDVEVMDDEEFGFDESNAGNELVLRTILEMLSEDPTLLDVPDLVMAWRLEDVPAFATQLKRLEVLAGLMLRNSPFGEDFKRQKLGEGDFLTLTFDGSKVNWEEQEIPGVDEEEGEFDELRKHLAKKKIVVALGNWRNYAMLAVVASPDRLARLGTVPALASRGEFKPLQRHKSQRLTSISYVSEAVIAANALNQNDLNDLVDLGKLLLEDAPIPGEMVTRLHEDLEALAKDLGALITKPGAIMAYSFLNDRGYESFSYDWNQYPTLDASKPLPLTQHVGGNPLMWLVQRGKSDPQAYDTLAKWAAKAFSYFEDFALDEMSESEREKAKAFIAEFKPLAERAHSITREKLLRSLADGQIALVLDDKIASQQWHVEMPHSKRTLRMLEIGLAIGVSDEKLLREAIGDYKQLADNLVEAFRKVEPGQIPDDYKIPAPQMTEIDGQSVHFYPLPVEIGFNALLAPSGGLNQEVLVFSTSPAQVARMLKTQEVSLVAGVTTQPLGMAGEFRWAETWSALLAWADYGVSQIPEDEGQEAQMVRMFWPEVRQGLSLLGCWKYSTWTSTLKDSALVTHGITVMEDVK